MTADDFVPSEGFLWYQENAHLTTVPQNITEVCYCKISSKNSVQYSGIRCFSVFVRFCVSFSTSTSF